MGTMFGFCLIVIEAVNCSYEGSAIMISIFRVIEAICSKIILTVPSRNTYNTSHSN
jgi:hypothetical protein